MSYQNNDKFYLHSISIINGTNQETKCLFTIALSAKKSYSAKVVTMVPYVLPARKKDQILYDVVIKNFISYWCPNDVVGPGW
jgi:hypothetical protein